MRRYTVGPVLSSFLYQHDGFYLPFLTVGLMGMATSAMLILSVPKVDRDQEEIGDSQGKVLNVKELIKVQNNDDIFFY